MNEESATDKAVMAATGAALLAAAGRSMNVWSVVFGIAAILLNLLPPTLMASTLLLAASMLVALAQAIFAVRCAFDAALFASFGGNDAHYQCFDQLLFTWGLNPSPTVTRSLQERVAGARRLLRSQLLCLLAQMALFAVGAGIKMAGTVQ